MPSIDRRTFLMSVSVAALAPSLMDNEAARALGNQAGSPPMRVRGLNHMTLAVSDPKRSIEFYQGLFGMPIQARQGPTVLLSIGSGPQFLALSAAGSAPPSINHFCLAVEEFDAFDAMRILEAHGVTRAEGPTGGMSGGPMKARIRMRGADFGGAPAGSPELYFGDPDGIVVQLQHPSYCGGAGAQGNICPAPEPARVKGLLSVRDLNHFTVMVSDSRRSNAFYQSLFGFGIQAYQGPNAPLLGVGQKGQFLMFAGGRSAKPGINHVCMSLEGFKPDQILKTLESYGIKPRENAQGPVGPMRHYVTLRMEDRGGAKDGTPELYFTDPDGILIQLQDVSYCGGTGFLGNLCSR